MWSLLSIFLFPGRKMQTDTKQTFYRHLHPMYSPDQTVVCPATTPAKWFLEWEFIWQVIFHMAWEKLLFPLSSIESCKLKSWVKYIITHLSFILFSIFQLAFWHLYRLLVKFWFTNSRLTWSLLRHHVNENQSNTRPIQLKSSSTSNHFNNCCLNWKCYTILYNLPILYHFLQNVLSI